MASVVFPVKRTPKLHPCTFMCYTESIICIPNSHKKCLPIFEKYKFLVFTVLNSPHVFSLVESILYRFIPTFQKEIEKKERNNRRIKEIATTTRRITHSANTPHILAMCPARCIALRMMGRFFDVMAGSPSDGSYNIRCYYRYERNVIPSRWTHSFSGCSSKWIYHTNHCHP